MAPSRDDTLSVAKSLAFDIPEHEVEEYTTLLAKMEASLEAVSMMEDYQPKPDLQNTPRKHLHFPSKEENPLNAWAWKCEIISSQPSSTLLKGATICLKDNICVADVPCLLGTETFTGWIPKMDATVVTRVLSAGAKITGKAVCENLSRGAVSVTAATGPVHNPYAHGYSIGGSSSGTAALVASGAVKMGIGCDQGGSIRIPASLGGLYGFKATAGLVPYTGIASNDASLDYVGPMTSTCLDNAFLLEAIAGADNLDDRQLAGTPSPKDVPKYSQLLQDTGLPLGLKIGILKEGLAFDIDPQLEKKFREAVDIFKTRLGATVEEVSVPLHSQGRTVYSVLSKMGNHMGMLGRASGRKQVMLTDLFEKKSIPYTPEIITKMSAMSKEGLMSGEFAWQKYPLLYPKAVNIARRLQDAYDEALSKFDILVMPTTISVAKPLPAVNASPLQYMAASTGMTENTSPFNMTGHPALAMPLGFVPATGDGTIKLPASMQLVGKYFDETSILKAAYAWEKTINWKEF